MKNRSLRYDINRPSLRHGHEHTKHKMCLGIIMIIYIKQHLGNFKAQFIKKLTNNDAELKKKHVFVNAYCHLNLVNFDFVYGPDSIINLHVVLVGEETEGSNVFNIAVNNN